jgi:GNAT superfamily N-acetyltransferase
VVELVFGALREHGIEPSPEVEDRDVFGVGSRGGRFVDLVAVDADGVVIGLGCLEPWNDRGWISKLFVAPEARGRKVGKSLLEALLTAARTDGMTHVGLRTRTIFASAVRLYESVGFVRDEDPEPRGVGEDRAYLLELGPSRRAR